MNNILDNYEQFVIVNLGSELYYGEGAQVLPGDEPHTYVKIENMLHEVTELLRYFNHTLDSIGIYKLVRIQPVEVARIMQDALEEYGEDKLAEDIEPSAVEFLKSEIELYISSNTKNEQMGDEINEEAFYDEGVG